jgi:hypothetical protein
VLHLFDHCSLAAEPDAALHVILVPLMKAAQTLESTPHVRNAIESMRAAVARYAKYFDDPDISDHFPVASHPSPRAPADRYPSKSVPRRRRPDRLARSKLIGAVALTSHMESKLHP